MLSHFFNPKDKWIAFACRSKLSSTFTVVVCIACSAVCSLVKAEVTQNWAPATRWLLSNNDLHRAPAKDSESTSTVSEGAILAVLAKNVQQEETYIFVKPLGISRVKSGWISLKATSAISQNGRPPDITFDTNSDEHLPLLIRRLPQKQQDDFRRLSVAIDDAAQKAVFIPDLYIARAELWTIAGETNEALSDFGTAASHALRASNNKEEQVAQLRNLCNAIERLQKSPRAAEGIEATDHATAAKHYDEGYTLFWNNLTAKSEQCFQNAIMLNPADPRYWYFRGLARRRKGDSKGAQHDVLVAAFLERSKPKSSVVPRALIRCQGTDRLWLETFRLGDPTQQLLQLELDDVTVHPGMTQ